MKTPSRVLDEIRRQMTEKLSKSESNKIGKSPPRDVLFFPRQKVKMRKEERPYSYQRALFIEKRKNEFSTRLEGPTEESGEGLVSGLRSAIMMDKNGKYIKLKGVNTPLHRTNPRYNKDHGEYYGLCTPDEAIMENVYVHLLGERYNFLAAKPGFTELHSFRPFFSNSSLMGKTVYSEKSKLRLVQAENLVERVNNFSGVSGIEIESDTRLDEVIYHLTEKELKGMKKTMRDSIIHYLCFNAGVSKAGLTIAGYTWGQMLENTNCHIGNFAINSDSQDMIDSRLIDLYTLRSKRKFSSSDKFIDFCKAEMEWFSFDFLDPVTASLPHQRRYKHFSKQLRDECFRAINTGYYLALMSANPGNSSFDGEAENFFIPEAFPLSAEEFRYEIKRLTR